LIAFEEGPPPDFDLSADRRAKLTAGQEQGAHQNHKDGHQREGGEIDRGRPAGSLLRDHRPAEQQPLNQGELAESRPAMEILDFLPSFVDTRAFVGVFG
jgi:hypothetical protein